MLGFIHCYNTYTTILEIKTMKENMKSKLETIKVIIVGIVLMILTVILEAKSQDAVIYKEEQNRVLVVYVKDSVFNALDERSNQKRVIIYKGRKVRFNQVRFDYAKWFEVGKIIRRY